MIYLLEWTNSKSDRIKHLLKYEIKNEIKKASKNKYKLCFIYRKKSLKTFKKTCNNWKISV